MLLLYMILLLGNLGHIFGKTTLDVVGEVDGRVTIMVHINPSQATNGWEVLLHSDRPVVTHVHVSIF